MNKLIFAVALVVVAGGVVFADGTNVEQSVTQEKVQENTDPAADQIKARRMAQRKKVAERTKKDFEAYGKDGMLEIERLYRAYAKCKDVETAELKTLLEKYPSANRTGCAVMYAAQRAGDQGEKWLKLAIEKSSDCYYGDGACVGAYARYYLAMLQKKAGNRGGQLDLFEEIKKSYPDAITHRGQLFSEFIK